jgi:hypothetical protein
MLTKGLVLDEGWHLVWPNAELWVVAPTGSGLTWFNVLYDTLLVLWGVIGATWIVHDWRHYGRRTHEAAIPGDRDSRA